VKLVDLHGSLEIRFFPSVELVIKADMPGGQERRFAP